MKLIALIPVLVSCSVYVEPTYNYEMEWELVAVEWTDITQCVQHNGEQATSKQARGIGFSQVCNVFGSYVSKYEWRAVWQ